MVAPLSQRIYHIPHITYHIPKRLDYVPCIIYHILYMTLICRYMDPLGDLLNYRHLGRSFQGGGQVILDRLRRLPGNVDEPGSSVRLWRLVERESVLDTRCLGGAGLKIHGYPNRTCLKTVLRVSFFSALALDNRHVVTHHSAATPLNLRLSYAQYQRVSYCLAVRPLNLTQELQTLRTSTTGRK